MAEKIHVLYIDDSPQDRERFRTLFAGHPVIEVSAFAATGRDGVRMAEYGAPDAAVIDNSLPDMTGLEAAELIGRASPGTQRFIVTDSGSVDLWQKAKAIGVVQVYQKPIMAQDLAPAIEEAVETFRRLSFEQSSRMPLFGRGVGPAGKMVQVKEVTYVQSVRKTIVMVISPKGGVGKTTLAVNMACAAATQAAFPVRACIVDLNEFGTVTIHLGMGTAGKDFRDGMTARNVLAFKYVDTLLPDDLEQYLARHESGLWVLPAVPSPVHFAEVDATLVKKIVEILSSSFDLIILDLPPTISADVAAWGVDYVDYILLVTTPDVQLIPGMGQIRDVLSQLGVEQKCYRIVNRFGMPGGMSLADMKKYMPFPVIGTVKDYPKVQEAVARGIPMVIWEPNGEFTDSVKTALNQIFPVFVSGPQKRGSSIGLFDKLFKRGGMK